MDQFNSILSTAEERISVKLWKAVEVCEKFSEYSKETRKWNMKENLNDMVDKCVKHVILVTEKGMRKY